ncbi:MAG: UDP-N-acetylmuramoyl-tripeptide--D-alanyl-D-alanine ligase [Ruminococcaceae bacterium]|nr:UDP-N-acetylmuramoyl-tripeptide--D-alanyl-D-alanine ligase [Oscillospiraceae bacterium]
MRIDLPTPLCAAGALSSLLGCKGTDPSTLCFSGIATDSREVQRGDLFVALRGMHCNGVAFAGEAAQKGAVAMLCDTGAAPRLEKLPLLEVLSVEGALLRAAAAWRRQLRGKFIAVSGSTGKTTVKELLAAVLSMAGSVEKSAGNFNSTLGMPLSLLAMHGSEYHVLEIGINHRGEMAPLSRALSPRLAVLTGVGSAHIGLFGSRQALLAEKMQLASGLTADGHLLLPEGLAHSAKDTTRVLTFGMRATADFCVTGIQHGKTGVVADIAGCGRTLGGLSWHMPGTVGLSCLSLGGAVGLYFGLDGEAIRQGLRQAQSKVPRMKRRIIDGRYVIDDTYNASPEAMIAALEALCYLGEGAPRAAVLGDMGELGGFSASLHREVGAAAAGAGLSHLFLYGRYAGELCEGALFGGLSPRRVHCFAVGEEKGLAAAILETMPRGAYILCKASREMRLERVISQMERIR